MTECKNKKLGTKEKSFKMTKEKERQIEKNLKNQKIFTEDKFADWRDNYNWYHFFNT